MNKWHAHRNSIIVSLTIPQIHGYPRNFSLIVCYKLEWFKLSSNITRTTLACEKHISLTKSAAKINHLMIFFTYISTTDLWVYIHTSNINCNYKYVGNYLSSREYFYFGYKKIYSSWYKSSGIFLCTVLFYFQITNMLLKLGTLL